MPEPPRDAKTTKGLIRAVHDAAAQGCWSLAVCLLLVGNAVRAGAQPVPSGASPIAAMAVDCPTPDLVVTRNAHLIVRYEGETDDGVCLQRVGGVQQSVWSGIWPASWPEAATAAQAARRVLAGPVGTREVFAASFDWVSTSFVSNTVWRFAVTNLGFAEVTVSGKPRPVMRLGWDEQSLGHPYKAHAEFEKDPQTGVILKQSFQLLLGSTTTATDFWSRYGGGLATVPDFQVTAIQ